jgi:hypothetical protein
MNSFVFWNIFVFYIGDGRSNVTPISQTVFLHEPNRLKKELAKLNFDRILIAQAQQITNNE